MTQMSPYFENGTLRQYLWKKVCFSAPHWQCNSQSVTNKELSPLRSSRSNICSTKVTKIANKITGLRNIHICLWSVGQSRTKHAIDWASEQIHDRGHRETLQELRVNTLQLISVQP